MIKRLLLILFTFNYFYNTPSADTFPETYIELSPEISYGVHDNGPAWVELVPLKANLQITKDTAVKGGFSYAFEIDRDKKPFGPPNHYGWRVCSKVETLLIKDKDMRLFYEINVGSKVPGAINSINYLQMTDYQRVGIVWRLWKIL